MSCKAKNVLLSIIFSPGLISFLLHLARHLKVNPRISTWAYSVFYCLNIKDREQRIYFPITKKFFKTLRGKRKIPDREVMKVWPQIEHSLISPLLHSVLLTYTLKELFLQPPLPKCDFNPNKFYILQHGAVWKCRKRNMPFHKKWTIICAVYLRCWLQMIRKEE